MEAKIKNYNLVLENAAKAFLEALSNSPYNNKPFTDARVVTNELLRFLSNSYKYNPNAINELKPAWSEEDEKMFNSAIWHINNSTHNGLSGNGSTVCDWLKSIKDRAQPHLKPEWNKSDEKMWAIVSDLLWEGYKQSDGKVSWKMIRNWLLPKIIYLKNKILLPQSIDEAAEIYYERDCPYDGEARVVNGEHDVWFPSQSIEDAFIAGAKWMAKQA